MTNYKTLFGTPAFLEQDENNDYRVGFIEDARVYTIEYSNQNIGELIEKIAKAMRNNERIRVTTEKKVIMEIE